MPRVIRDTLVSVRELLFTAGPFIVLTVALLAGAFYFMQPTPPKRVVLATGSEQGAYAEFGKRYAEELRRYGIAVQLRSTPGSRENLRLLHDAKRDVDIAFVQGGSSETQRTQNSKCLRDTPTAIVARINVAEENAVGDLLAGVRG